MSDYSSLCPCNHEEADTRKQTLAIAVVHQLNLNELWAALGVSSSLRYISAHEIANSLRLEKSRSLPVFHAYFGCDTISAFHGKGKKHTWNTWSNFGDVKYASQILSDSPASRRGDHHLMMEVSPNYPSSNDWGWKKLSGGKCEPKWISLPEAMSSCLELLSCKCSKKSRCSKESDNGIPKCDCAQYGLICTGLCCCHG